MESDRIGKEPSVRLVQISHFINEERKVQAEPKLEPGLLISDTTRKQQSLSYIKKSWAYNTFLNNARILLFKAFEHWVKSHFEQICLLKQF